MYITERSNLTYKQGNLLDMFEEGQFDLIAHGCNCEMNMSGGIAQQIAQRYPQAVQADYLSVALWGTNEVLGKYTISRVMDYGKSKAKERHIVNLYTQLWAGNDFRLNALIDSLRMLNRQEAKNRGGFLKRLITKKRTIGLPLIGCGIGGGDWKQVEAVFQSCLSEFNVTVVHYIEER